MFLAQESGRPGSLATEKSGSRAPFPPRQENPVSIYYAITEGLSAQAVTRTLVGFILLSSLFALICRHRASRRGTRVPELIRILPNSMTSFGAFGTFLGICIGLKDFDFTQIDDSIPLLLAGLQTAFMSSVCGMFANIVLRFIFGYYDGRDSISDSDSSDDPVVYLRRMAESNAQMNRQMLELGQKVVDCFHSDSELSLVSQMGMIRGEIQTMHTEIKSSLDHFGEKVAELGTEAMITALREVITQFNTHLSDLVGTEFKQLRGAMIELNRWQKAHKAQVADLHSRLSEASGSLESSADAMARIDTSLSSSEQSLAKLSVSAEDVATHVEQLQSQNAQLAAFLKEIETLGTKAKTAMPNLESKITGAADQLVKASEKARKAFDQVSEDLDASVKALGEQLEANQKRHSKQLDDSLVALEQKLEKTHRQSLISLGTQLATLSQKFVDDYEPLTQKLRQVVRLAERSPNGSFTRT